jgi:hypothetical protein
MTLSTQLTDRLDSLAEEQKNAVKEVYSCEVALNIARRWKNRVTREIMLCKADLGKIEENVR